MRNVTFLTPTVTFIATIAFTVMLGVVDWASGYELQFFVFYFIPVAVAAWRCKPRQSYFVAILSTFVWFVADWFSGHPYSHVVYAIWNTSVRLIAFLVIGFTMSRIKLLLVAQREISRELQQALSEVKTLKGLLPICSVCKKIRNDKGYWQRTEEYIETHSDAQFTHGYCDQCTDKILKEHGINLSDTKPGPED